MPPAGLLSPGGRAEVLPILSLAWHVGNQDHVSGDPIARCCAHCAGGVVHPDATDARRTSTRDACRRAESAAPDAPIDHIRVEGLPEASRTRAPGPANRERAYRGIPPGET